MQKLEIVVVGGTRCHYLFSKLKERSGKCSQQPIKEPFPAGLMKEHADLKTCEVNIPHKFLELAAPLSLTLSFSL